MKIVVDRDLCEGHGQCEFAAPDVFQINDDGDLDLLEDSPAEAQRREVEEAVRRCPARALLLED